MTPLRFLFHLVREAGSDDLGGMASEMAYRFLFALLPLLLLTITVLGFVGEAVGFDDLVQRTLDQARPLVPPSVSDVIELLATALLEERSGVFLTIGLIGTLWGAAAGIGTLIKGLNRAYDIEHPRPALKRQGLTLLITALLPLVGLASLVLTSAGEQLAAAVVDVAGLGGAARGGVEIAQQLLVAVLFFFGMTLVYALLPAIRLPYRRSLPGAAFTTIGMIVFTVGFGFYLDLTRSSAATHAAFGAAIVFLLWLYFISLVTLLGAEINSLLASDEWRRQDAS